jgi:hypothetical protein
MHILEGRKQQEAFVEVAEDLQGWKPGVMNLY